MAGSDQLRKLRTGTVINLPSKKQEEELGKALLKVEARLKEQFSVQFHHVRGWKLADVVHRLRDLFPAVEFYYSSKRSSMRPDGGILSIEDQAGVLYPILISEAKKQGTNDKRLKEGKPKQSRGNAIGTPGQECHRVSHRYARRSNFPFRVLRLRR